MKTANLVKAVCVAGLAATCVLGLAACAASEDKPAAEGYTGGVAATVNGTEIPEDTITAQIQMIRAQMSVDTEDAWGAWLAENGYTPETVREQIISGYADQELVRQGAGPEGRDRGRRRRRGRPERHEGAVRQRRGLAAGARDSPEPPRKTIGRAWNSRSWRATCMPRSPPAKSRPKRTCSPMRRCTCRRSTMPSVPPTSCSAPRTRPRPSRCSTRSTPGRSTSWRRCRNTPPIRLPRRQDGDVGWDKLSSFDAAYQEALDGLEKDQVSGLVDQQLRHSHHQVHRRVQGT